MFISTGSMFKEVLVVSVLVLLLGILNQLELPTG